MKQKLLISACLDGTPCRYDGKSKPCLELEKLNDYFELIPICPETEGGLPTPRFPSEIIGDRVVNSQGDDVTVPYRLGAERAVKAAIVNGCKYALLKARSPSCANNAVYDGSFTKTLVNGSGIAAKALMEAGIKVYNENEIELLLEQINN